MQLPRCNYFVMNFYCENHSLNTDQNSVRRDEYIFLICKIFREPVALAALNFSSIQPFSGKNDH